MKRYIIWSTRRQLDLDDPFLKRWYIEKVLTHGRTEDVADLDWGEVKTLLPRLRLPERVRRLWENYFASEKR